jgi:hypothetical protein
LRMEKMYNNAGHRFCPLQREVIEMSSVMGVPSILSQPQEASVQSQMTQVHVRTHVMGPSHLPPKQPEAAQHEAAGGQSGKGGAGFPRGRYVNARA